MNKRFQKEIGEIYRLKVPFENLYTSVFLIKTKSGNMLVDCGSCDSDVDEYIIPALFDMGLSLFDISGLILTHSHGDHAGGKFRVLEVNPKMQITEKTVNGYTVYALKGHTEDCIGVFDENTGTLISGDALQGYGVGKYRCFLENRREYIKTIEKIEQNERIKNILFSHAYEPWERCSVFGREDALKILKDCKNYIIGE